MSLDDRYQYVTTHLAVKEKAAMVKDENNKNFPTEVKTARLDQVSGPFDRCFRCGRR